MPRFIILLNLIYLSELITSMRLLMITRKLDKDDGGAGFIYGWVKTLSQKVEKLDVVCLDKGNISGLPDNVAVFSLGKETYGHHSHWLRRVVACFRFYRYLWQLRNDYDHVFVHMHTVYILLAGWLWKLSGRKVGLWYAHVRVSHMAKWASYFVDYIFSPSGESFVFSTKKLIKTGHGIDTAIFKPAAKERKGQWRIVSVGRITQIKDYTTLVEAIKILTEEYHFDNFKIAMVGQPTRKDDFVYFEKLKKQIQDDHLEKYFHWVGDIANKDVASCYQRADVFVNMQQGGGFGKSVLEAMACGVVCVLCSPVYKKMLGSFAQDTLFEEKNPRQMAERLNIVFHWPREKFNDYSQLTNTYVKQNHNLETLMDKIVKVYSCN